MTFDQSGFDVRCEWGENGIRHLAHGADAVIIVDVLYFRRDPIGAAFAQRLGAEPGDRNDSDIDRLFEKLSRGRNGRHEVRPACRSGPRRRTVGGRFTAPGL
jgi:hypothetical protein